MGYLEAVRERVVVFDGATGTNLQLRELGPDDFGGPALEGCNEILAVTRPDVVAELHASFFEVGCDVVETNTFGAFSVPLGEYGIEDRTVELNLAAARIARSVADDFATPARPRWVAGSMGPGTKFPSLGNIRFADLRDAYQAQAGALLEGGVDLLIVETVFDLLQAKAAMIACRRAMVAAGRTVPLQVQVTIELTGRMLPGTEIGAALAALDPLRPDVIGLNCATGPAEMHEHLRHLAAHARMPVSCVPNAGLPSVVEGRMHYDLTPEQLAEHHHRFITEFGVSVVGGCCGTTPTHLAAVVEHCGGLVPAPRAPVHEPAAASIYTAVPLMLDSTEPDVVEVGLQWIGGKPILNSVNLEDGDAPGTRLDRFLTLAREYGAAVVCTCIDTEGQARTAEWKLRAARAIHDLAVDRYGLEPSDLLF
ncbi:MAG: homocysteine S-methyltransferase family protein, partial [Actinomycetota bacterium]|nr:homocysteine S-methyltransferase family protein [Actinomycetota bacterium]